MPLRPIVHLGHSSALSVPSRGSEPSDLHARHFQETGRWC